METARVVAPAAHKTLSLAPVTTIYEIVAETPKQDAVTYSKGVQTEDAWKDDDVNTYDDNDDFTNKQSQRREDEIRLQLRKEIEQELQATGKAHAKTNDEKEQKPPSVVKTLKQDETSALVTSGDFIDFLERSSKIAERALEEDYNVLADYKFSDLEDPDASLGQRKTGRGLRQLMQFYDERWSKKRMITDLDFSPKVCNVEQDHRESATNSSYSSLNWFSLHTRKVQPHHMTQTASS